MNKEDYKMTPIEEAKLLWWIVGFILALVLYTICIILYNLSPNFQKYCTNEGGNYLPLSKECEYDGVFYYFQSNFEKVIYMKKNNIQKEENFENLPFHLR